MKVTKIDGRPMRRILTEMIVNDRFLSIISSRWNKDGMFHSRWADLVGSWCVKYHKKYGHAPKRAIENIYAAWSTSTDKETSELIGKFLMVLDDEHDAEREEKNVRFLVDLAGKYFNETKASSIAQEVQGYIESGRPDEGLKLLETFKRVELGATEMKDVFQDATSFVEALDPKNVQRLITYKGDLGFFMGDALARDSFIAFMAPEKRGKSWTLQDIAFRGVLHRKRVAYFEAGDMSEHQVQRRFLSRIARHPIKPGTLIIPTAIRVTQDTTDYSVFTHDVASEPHEFKTGLDMKYAKRQVDKLNQKLGKESYLKLANYPNSTLTVSAIRETLLRLADSGWVPDIVIIDYADILAAPNGTNGEHRETINANWKAMRALSQELHCLVVTATQADAASYNAASLGMKNFSEDKRKFGHVTGMIGLNQTANEKKEGVMRWNWLVLREEEFSVERFVWTAGCLGIANPTICSGGFSKNS